MVDLGCGYGGVTRFVADYFDIPEAYGMDMNDERMPIAKSRGITVFKNDMNRDTLPFPDKHFGLVTSFGLLEHLIYSDNALSEAHRVLEDDGYFVMAHPNLGSYVNGIAILLGYQPRNVEVSCRFSPRLLPGIPKGPIAHLHTATLRSMKELMQCLAFHIVGAVGSSPFRANPMVDALDRVTVFIPSLSRRFMIVAKKQPMRRHREWSAVSCGMLSWI